MSARLTAREARAIGLELPTAPAGKRTAQRRLRALYASTCAACGDPFTSEAAEVRHMTATGHRRFVWHDGPTRLVAGES